jgi:ubiquinone biosynthesis protein COQ9
MKSMQTMLKIAGLLQDESRNAMSAFGLGAIYVASLYSWQKDESKDMTATMAALDRHLKRASKLAELLFHKF